MERLESVEKIKNPEIRDQVKEHFLSAGYKEDSGTSKTTDTTWLTHPTGRHVYIQPDKNSESGWSIMFRDGLGRNQRNKIAKLLGQLTGDEADNRKEILEEGGQFSLGTLIPGSDDPRLPKGNETYAIRVVG